MTHHTERPCAAAEDASHAAIMTQTLTLLGGGGGQDPAGGLSTGYDPLNPYGA